MNYRFPENFLWGAATSAHQVEGGTHNQWSEWEKENAARLAHEARTKWHPWQVEKFPEMLTPENYISGRACDHYHRYEEDFDIAASLHHNAHRLSIEWSRIEPEEGVFDEKEIEHYRKVLLALRARGIEPFVTLWHYTLPLWFYKKGGWAHKDSPIFFERYVKKIAREFHELVSFWITLNESLLIVAGSYLKGYRPPQRHNPIIALHAINNLAEAHKQAYKIIHEIQDSACVGLSEWLSFFDTSGSIVQTNVLQRAAKHFANEYLLEKVSDHLDFIGVQHYMYIPFSISTIQKDKQHPKNDMNWSIVPRGMYEVLMDMKKYNLPIYITENGIPDADDTKRAKFIKEHLKQVHRAISEGANVRGYFYWSLLDNFEWDKGFWPRFGLVAVDYKTLKRTIRPSALEYAKICKENGF